MVLGKSREVYTEEEKDGGCRLIIDAGSSRELEEQVLNVVVDLKLSEALSNESYAEVLLKNGNTARVFRREDGGILYSERYPNGNLCTRFSAIGNRVEFFRQYERNGDLYYDANFYPNGILMSTQIDGEEVHYNKNGRELKYKVSDLSENVDLAFKVALENKKRR